MPEEERARVFATARRLLGELLGIEGTTTVAVAYRAVGFRTHRDWSGVSAPEPAGARDAADTIPRHPQEDR